MSDPQNRSRLSAVNRLTAALTDRIERGEYASGEWLPTERDLAIEFRADRSTVRAAFAALAQKNLILRERGRRSRVSVHSASPPPSPGSDAPPNSLQMLAVLTPQTPMYHASSAIQRGALDALRQMEAPYHLLVLDNEAETRSETFRRERQALEVIHNEAIRGVILWHQGNAETLPDVRHLQETGVPIIMVDRHSEALSCDFVGIDNVEAAREAVSYLLSLGHRRIGHLTMDDPTLTVRDREQGYREAMQLQGGYPAEEWIFRMSDSTRLQPSVIAAVDHFLSLAEPPTAMFAMNDLLAHAFLAELHARGVRVPEQISVIGFDDVDEFAPRPSPLTTVHQPFERMGRRAMELLLARLAAPADAPLVFQHVLLPTHLVLRSSCSPYHTNH